MKARQIFDKGVGTVAALYDRVAEGPTYPRTITHTKTHTYTPTHLTLNPDCLPVRIADVSFTACSMCNQSANNSWNLTKVAALATHSL